MSLVETCLNQDGMSKDITPFAHIHFFVQCILECCDMIDVKYLPIYYHIAEGKYFLVESQKS